MCRDMPKVLSNAVIYEMLSCECGGRCQVQAAVIEHSYTVLTTCSSLICPIQLNCEIHVAIGILTYLDLSVLLSLCIIIGAQRQGW